jgi:polysaccharide biosynthesis transport protein
MGKNEIEPRGGAPLWPVAPAGSRELAFATPVPVAEKAESGLDLNLATLWRVFWEWRWFILGAAALGLMAALVYTFLQTPLYRSTSTIELNPPAVEIMEGAKATPVVPNDREFLATQYGLLSSRALAARVAQDLNLASNAALVSQELDRGTRENIVTGMLMSGLEVKPVPQSRLVRLHFTSPDPALAARVVNGYADGFISSGLERRYQASSYARDFLERQIATVRRDLETSERQLVAYAQQQGIINMRPTEGGGGSSDTAANSLTGESLASLNQALSVAQTRRISAEQRYREALTAGQTAEVNERTSVLRGQRAALQAEYEEKLTLFQPDYPEMTRLRTRIAALDESIAAEARGVQSSRANTLRADYQAAVAEEQSLAGRVEQLRGAVLDLRGRTIQYNILQRDVDTNRSLYEALLQRYKEIGVAGGIGTAQASVVDRGQAPGGPYKPNMPLNLLIGLALGLLAGMGAALLYEFINDTIKTPDDVREKLKLAFLGAIPRKKTDSILDELADASSQLSEAYFSLATSLQFVSETGAPKTLLVTSTRPAEGKSTSTWGLALSFARIGKRVLLIDSDMRKPTFKVQRDDKTGLSQLLTHADPVADHVYETESENIWLLPCGPLPPNPAELLSGSRIRAVLAEATEQFDIVIVDGPPVLGLADAPLLGSICDGTLLVTEAAKTRTRAAVESLHRLRESGTRLVGAVLTRYRHQAAGYGYYSYEPYKYGGLDKREREIRLITKRGE